MHQERFGPIDFEWFHREELPALLRRQGAIFSETDAEVVRPLAFQISDGGAYNCGAYTYVPQGSTFSVQPGTGAAHTVVELSLDSWRAFAWELKTCFALLYGDQLTVSRGSFGQLARWEPPLRVALSNQSLFDLDHPARIEDEAGCEVDLTKSFTLEDPATETREFLHAGGLRASAGGPGRGRDRRTRGPTSSTPSAGRDPTTGNRGGRPSTAERCATG